MHILEIYACYFFSALVEYELWRITNTRILLYFYNSIDIATFEFHIRIFLRKFFELRSNFRCMFARGGCKVDYCQLFFTCQNSSLILSMILDCGDLFINLVYIALCFFSLIRRSLFEGLRFSRRRTTGLDAALLSLRLARLGCC